MRREVGERGRGTSLVSPEVERQEPHLPVSIPAAGVVSLWGLPFTVQHQWLPDPGCDVLSPVTAPGRQHHYESREMGASKTRTGRMREIRKRYPGSWEARGIGDGVTGCLCRGGLAVGSGSPHRLRTSIQAPPLLPSCSLPRLLALSAPCCCGHQPRWGLYPLPAPISPVLSRSQGMLGNWAPRVLQVLGETPSPHPRALPASGHSHIHGGGECIF